MAAAIAVNPASSVTTVSTSDRCGRTHSAMRPPAMAPTTKKPRAHALAATEKPGAPASPKATRTTFPVMLAVNTWPSPRKLTASTMPLTTVSTARDTTRGWGGRSGSLM